MTKFIRVKETIIYDEGKITKVYLMSLEKYLNNPFKVAYGHRIDKKPYKFWQIWYLIEVPAFYIHLFLYRSLKIKETKKTAIASLIFASILDATVVYWVTTLFDYLKTLH